MISNPLHNVRENYMHPELMIENIIDSMRSTGNITNIVDNGNGTYTVTVDNISNFYSGTYVTITDTIGFNSETQKIQNVTSNGFDIVKSSGITIPSELGSYKANAPYYDFAKWIEAANTLTNKDESINWRDQKYPLILMLLKFESSNKDLDSIHAIGTLSLYFIDQSKQDITSRERLEYVFKNQIYSVYSDFITAMKNSGYVKMKIGRVIERDEEKLYFTGTEDANQNKLNATIEALKITFKDLKFKNLSRICINR